MKALIFSLLLLVAASASGQNFTKVTIGPLVNTAGDSRSVNWIDANSDGFIDCQITNGPYPGQNDMLYINNGSGNFTAVSGDPIVQDAKPSDGASWADTDNDGDLDCFVVNWYGANNMFYTNDGSGNFTKITTGSPVTDGGYSETASWGDYDNDGRVDLYVTNSAGTKENFLYKNMGGNTFQKITLGDPVTDTMQSRCINWTDIDLDGDLDLFVSNEGGEDENLYRNDGNGNFTKLSVGALLTNAGNTMSGSWGDIDNDGDLDVFLANDQSNNALFRNDGNFNFTKLTSDTVSQTPGRSFSSAWSDVDNDGDLDLFVTNAFKPGSKLVNYFYLNSGSGSFTRINNVLTADSAWSYGCAFGDYDNDGFEDLAVATCRFAGADKTDFLYHNNGNANHWITIHLHGTVSNVAAIGAKVRLKAKINGTDVWQYREVSAQNAYCSQNDLRVHFGLGDALQADSLKIEWPSGLITYSLALGTNQFLEVTENNNTVSILENKSDKLQIRFFPNPSQGLLYLQNPMGFMMGDKITVTDLHGKQVAQFSVHQATQQYSVDLRKEGIASGNYTVTISRGSEKMSAKVILQLH